MKREPCLLLADCQRLLREILVGPIQFTPLERAQQRGHAFRGEVSLSTLLAGSVGLPAMGCGNLLNDGGVPAGIRDKVESMRFTGTAA